MKQEQFYLWEKSQTHNKNGDWLEYPVPIFIILQYHVCYTQRSLQLLIPLQ